MAIDIAQVQYGYGTPDSGLMCMDGYPIPHRYDHCLTLESGMLPALILGNSVVVSCLQGPDYCTKNDAFHVFR